MANPKSEKKYGTAKYAYDYRINRNAPLSIIVMPGKPHPTSSLKR
jgi:hypothetical protein